MGQHRDHVIDLRDDAPRTAFVLAGGATRGAIQVGMLAALTERGILPDLVVGTSVGAMNGAAYVADPTPEGVDRLDRAWGAGPHLPDLPDRAPLDRRERARAPRLPLPQPRHQRLDRDAPRARSARGLPHPPARRGHRGRRPVVRSCCRGATPSPPCWPAPRSRGSSRRCRSTARSCTTVAWPPTYRCRRRSSSAPTRVFVLPTLADETPRPTAWLLLDRVFGRPGGGDGDAAAPRCRGPVAAGPRPSPATRTASVTAAGSSTRRTPWPKRTSTDSTGVDGRGHTVGGDGIGPRCSPDSVAWIRRRRRRTSSGWRRPPGVDRSGPTGPSRPTRSRHRRGGPGCGRAATRDGPGRAGGW